MCKVCGSFFGHKYGCPEAEEPEAEIIGECALCRNNIEEGQDYFDTNNGYMYHYDCFCDEYFHRG